MPSRPTPHLSLQKIPTSAFQKEVAQKCRHQPSQ
nr:MAG TPA: hypothetical protein [Caudoviricetes sp.]